VEHTRAASSVWASDEHSDEHSDDVSDDEIGSALVPRWPTCQADEFVADDALQVDDQK
jgi:hypothetical protein